jgi:uroporphyrinogen decarboxylase
MKSVLLVGTLALGHALNIQMSAAPAGATAMAASKTGEPLLLRAARGEVTESTPVWMMRQAGRHMKVYRDLVKDYPTFRERSEIPDVSFEISMQPRDAYGTDGVILFSDILT